MTRKELIDALEKRISDGEKGIAEWIEAGDPHSVTNTYLNLLIDLSDLLAAEEGTERRFRSVLLVARLAKAYADRNPAPRAQALLWHEAARALSLLASTLSAEQIEMAAVCAERAGWARLGLGDVAGAARSYRLAGQLWVRMGEGMAAVRAFLRALSLAEQTSDRLEACWVTTELALAKADLFKDRAGAAVDLVRVRRTFTEEGESDGAKRASGLLERILAEARSEAAAG